MTEYLKEYMKYAVEQLEKSDSKDELCRLLAEHRDKIAFMQHERLVHFLVTMMFAIILVMFVIAELFTENIMLTVLIIIILVLLAAYIKHYYFLENTVQKMYRVYDDILKKIRSYSDK